MTKTEAAALRHREAIAAGAAHVGKGIATAGSYLKVLFVGTGRKPAAKPVAKPTARRTTRKAR